MSKSISVRLIAALLVVVCSVFGACRSASLDGRDSVQSNLSAGVDKFRANLCVRTSGLSSKLFLLFYNGSESTVWIPIQSNPAYRPEAQGWKIWFGYSEEVDGPHKGQYMLPEMHPVQPGGEFEFELTSPMLINGLMAGSKDRAKIQVRIAMKDFPYSRVRNGQPFQDYINNSVIFDSGEYDSGVRSECR